MGASLANALGNYLRNLRKSKGLTTRQLADMAGCDHSFVARLETGDRSPKLDLLWQLIELLDGHYGYALYLLCLDSGVPEEVAREATQSIGPGNDKKNN